MKTYFTLLILLFFTNTAFSQIKFWEDNFEKSTATSGTRTPEGSGGVGGPPYTSYFTSTDGSTVSQVVAFTGKQGTYYWAGEDHNATGTGLPSADAGTDDVNNELSITWTGINIANRANLQFKGLLAANSTSQPWDNKNACLSGSPSTNTDYIIVQYRIDNGTWTDLLRFFNKGGASGTGLTWKNLYEDTDNNGCGEGTMLTNVFGQFTKTIPGSGAVLDLRLNVYCEGTNEEWGADNFQLFSSNGLPVSLVDFSGNNTPEGNKLKWSTASEQNNKSFEIERSADCIVFENIGSVRGNGFSNKTLNYTFTDKEPSFKKIYYRLKQVDVDGKYEYSTAIVVRSDREAGIKIYPNPISNIVTVEIDELPRSKTDIRILDMNGKQLPLRFSKTGDLWHCDLNGLASGSYVVKTTANESVVTKVIVKK